MNLEKVKREFAAKRCEQVLINSEKGRKASMIIGKLMQNLNAGEKNLLIEYIDEINLENADIQEELYIAGFVDGIIMASEHMGKFFE